MSCTFVIYDETLQIVHFRQRKRVHQFHNSRLASLHQLEVQRHSQPEAGERPAGGVGRLPRLQADGKERLLGRRAAAEPPHSLCNARYCRTACRVTRGVLKPVPRSCCCACCGVCAVPAGVAGQKVVISTASMPASECLRRKAPPPICAGPGRLISDSDPYDCKL